MADGDFKISDTLRVRPTEESRAGLAQFGITDRAVQDDCYRTLADGLAKASRAREAEAASAAEYARSAHGNSMWE